MVHSVTPMQYIRFFGVPLSNLDEVDIAWIIEANITFADFIDFFVSQLENIEEKGIIDMRSFVFRFYLELVAYGWLIPDDSEIEEDLCILFT